MKEAKPGGNIGELERAAGRLRRPVRFMEVCGTHTMSAFRSGLRSVLPDTVRLISGPGCPVCVTPGIYIDKAVAVARLPETVVATFGDMVRVPGVESSLERAIAEGCSVRVVYSPADALGFAERQRDVSVVFLGVGFETTAPATAWTIAEAERRGIANYTVMCAHKTIPQAMEALLSGGETAIDGFLCPGHVSVITGARIYEDICRKYGIPCVVAGFEASDMARGLVMLMRQLADGRAEVEIQYSRSVDREGNVDARSICGEVFEPCDTEWRGLGRIGGSGLRIRDRYAAHDADRAMADIVGPVERGLSASAADPPGCLCGPVLRGAAVPDECPMFGVRCTPLSPVGPCMVSGEGTCAAYYRYGSRSGKDANPGE